MSHSAKKHQSQFDIVQLVGLCNIDEDNNIKYNTVEPHCIKVTHGLGKSDLNGEVTLLQGVICTVEYNLGLSHGDCNGEVFVLVR